MSKFLQTLGKMSRNLLFLHGHMTVRQALSEPEKPAGNSSTTPARCTAPGNERAGSAGAPATRRIHGAAKSTEWRIAGLR